MSCKSHHLLTSLMSITSHPITTGDKMSSGKMSTGKRLKQNLELFFKIYICPALLHLKPLTFCANCDKGLLEENEIDVSEHNDLSSIKCNICCAWFHYKCENIKSSEINHNNIEWIYSNCLATTASS